MPERILVDQDGVLADFENGFLNAWKQKFPERPFVPIEERKTFSIRRDYPEEYSEDIYKIYTAKGFIENLPLIPGAIEAIRQMQKAGHFIKICTSPLSRYDNCVTEKFAWVERHFGIEWTKNIIIAKDKTQIRGDFLIDDKPEITGDMNPIWEQIVFDQPYNKHITKKRRLISWDNWQTVLNS